MSDAINELFRWKLNTRIIATITSLMDFIPFVSFFAPPFGGIAAFHYVMKVKEERSAAE